MSESATRDSRFKVKEIEAMSESATRDSGFRMGVNYVKAPIGNRTTCVHTKGDCRVDLCTFLGCAHLLMSQGASGHLVAILLDPEYALSDAGLRRSGFPNLLDPKYAVERACDTVYRMQHLAQKLMARNVPKAMLFAIIDHVEECLAARRSVK